MDFRADWDAQAYAYEEFNNSVDSYSYNIEWPCIKAQLPELAGKAVLDLGCGTGIFIFLLEQYHPAQLLGIDISPQMLKIAEDKAEQIDSVAGFICGDACAAADLVGRDRFDLVFSSTASHYIKDLGAFFAAISACLKVGGQALLSVIHPVYSAQYPLAHGERLPDDEEWQVRYLDKNLRGYVQPWVEHSEVMSDVLSHSFHHTFADYLNAALAAGLTLLQVEEPLPPEDWRSSQPFRYDAYIETPTYLVLRFGK